VIPGKYVLHASRPGYVNPAINGVRLKDGGEDRAVTVAPGQLAQNADLTLIRGAVVAGRVVDPTEGLSLTWEWTRGLSRPALKI
jgi:hypothetical protein